MPSDVVMRERLEYQPCNSPVIQPWGPAVKGTRRAVENPLVVPSSRAGHGVPDGGARPSRHGFPAPRPDPAALGGFAARIDPAASAPLLRAVRLGLAIAATGWRGPASRAFGV